MTKQQIEHRRHPAAVRNVQPDQTLESLKVPHAPGFAQGPPSCLEPVIHSWKQLDGHEGEMLRPRRVQAALRSDEVPDFDFRHEERVWKPH